MSSGILLGAEIRKLIDANQLIESANVDRIRSCSYDLAVGTIFYDGKIIREIEPDLGVTLPPGGVVSIFTRESLKLPDDVIGTAFAINAMSREGFLVLNPGHVDPGFKGPLTVKAINLRTTPMLLQIGAPVFTVIFERISSGAVPYPYNTSRPEREMAFHRREVEIAPRTLLDATDGSHRSLAPSRDEVDTMIAKHWTSRVTLFATAVAALCAVWLIVEPRLIAHENENRAAHSDAIAKPLTMQLSPDPSPTSGVEVRADRTKTTPAPSGGAVPTAPAAADAKEAGPTK